MPKIVIKGTRVSVKKLSKLRSARLSALHVQTGDIITMTYPKGRVIKFTVSMTEHTNKSKQTIKSFKFIQQ